MPVAPDTSGATGMLLLGGLPAIPASLAPTRIRGAHDEAQQPDDQHDDGEPPQCLQREARAEEEQSQQKNDKQGNHSYQPPSLLVPADCKNTRSISLISPRLLRQLTASSTAFTSPSERVARLADGTGACDTVGDVVSS